MSLRHKFRDAVHWHVNLPMLHLLVRPDGHMRRITVADMLLPVGLVNQEWICYCVGVGEDIRFENYLTNKLGAKVWAFDPTPRAIKFMEATPHNLHFIPKGLWKEDATLRFYAPHNPKWVSHSITEKSDFGHFDAPCVSMASAMKSLGHDRVDLLKMNIEGAEHEVLEAMLAARIFPRVIIVAWEGNDALLKAHRWTRRLRRDGYDFVGRVAWFFTYVRGAKWITS